MILLIIIMIFCILFFTYLCNNIIYKCVMGNTPPGPWGIPFIGFLIHFIIGGKNYTKKLIELKIKYKGIASVQLGSYNCIWLNDYKLIREAFGNPLFCGRPKIPGITSRMHGFNGGLIFNEGQDFIEQRRFFSKTLKELGFGRLSMESLIMKEAVVLIKSFQHIGGRFAISTRHCFNIAAINALWQITTGERFEHDDARINQLAETLNRNLELNGGAKAAFFMPWLAKYFPRLCGWNYYLNDANEIFDFWKEYVGVRILKFKSENKEQHQSNFIDSYIQTIQECTDKSSSFYGLKGELSLAATLQDLFIAGMETTSTALSWACLYLAVFQEVQNKLFKEINQVIGRTTLPTLMDRVKMPYTEAVLYEILRFGTLVPLGFLHRTTQDMEFHGYFIPIDTIIQANILAVHGDKEYWGDPENFRPERFLSLSPSTGDLQLVKHEAFLPFSCGKRLCLGENLAKDEFFLFLTTIVQYFSISTDPNSPNPSLYPKIGATAIPQDHKLIFKERV